MPQQVFVANVDHVLSPGHITGALASKVMKVSARFVHYPFSTVVLPGPVDPDFVAYAASLGHSPTVYVARGIDPNRMSVMDAFSDPELLELIRGASVHSYIRMPELHDAVVAAGGHYFGGDPRPYSHVANSKMHFHRVAQGVVATPPNCVYGYGTTNIAAEVYSRLRDGRDVFVRLDNSGGGFGNRRFLAKEWTSPNLGTIVEFLEGDDAESWRTGVALIEDVVDLAYSPGVAFSTRSSLLYDYLQITRGGTDNVGRWTPVPPWICSIDRIAEIADHFAGILSEAGYDGDADTDLGVDADGTMYGFEWNGRYDGSRETIEVGQRLHGPWSTWRDNGVVAKSVTDFNLSSPMSFDELHGALAARGLLASERDPWGAVILIPPAGSFAGIAVFGPSYESTEATYQQINDLVGDTKRNIEDNPLFAALDA